MALLRQHSFVSVMMRDMKMKIFCTRFFKTESFGTTLSNTPIDHKNEQT